MRKFTFTAVKPKGAEIVSKNYNDEVFFLRAMCEAQAAGFVIIYAAVIYIDNERVAWCSTTLDKYCSEL